MGRNKINYDANGFGKYIKAKYYNATNAARVFGLSPLTVINNIKKPTGGYKLFGDLYQQYVDTQDILEKTQAMYASLSEKYNALVEDKATEEQKMTEYLSK